MPVPVILAAIGRYAGYVAASKAVDMIQPLTVGVTRGLSGIGNYWTPNVLASPEMAFDAFAMDQQISNDEANQLIRASGIGGGQPVPGLNLSDANVRALLTHFNSRRPRPNLDTLLNLRARGFFKTDERWASIAKWHMPNIGDFTEFCQQLDYTLTTDEIRLAFLRGKLTDVEMKRWLARTGVVNEKEREIHEEFAKLIPGMSDLVHFMVRESFTAKIVNDNDYGRGFPRRLKEWAGKQGYDYPLGFKVRISYDDAPDAYEEVEATWAIVYWLAHWQRMSPTQSAEGLHRLRAGRVPDADVWDEEKHNTLLQVNDYPTPDRKVLTAISYKILGRIDIKRVHYLGVWDDLDGKTDREELVDRYKDAGYTEEDAGTLAESTIRDNSRRKNRELIGLTRSRIQSAYYLGIIDDAESRRLLVSIGYDQSQADAAVIGWKLEHDERLAKKMIVGVKRNYLLGDYQEGQARAALARHGVLPFRVDEYIRTWDQTQRRYRLMYAPSTLSKWLILGTITVDEMERRLGNIGWAPEDIVRIIAAAVASKKDAPPAEAEVPKGKSGRGGESKPAELSRGELKQMLRDNVMTRDEVSQALTEQGLDAIDRDRLLKLWEGA